MDTEMVLAVPIEQENIGPMKRISGTGTLLNITPDNIVEAKIIIIKCKNKTLTFRAVCKNPPAIGEKLSFTGEVPEVVLNLRDIYVYGGKILRW